MVAREPAHRKVRRRQGPSPRRRCGWLASLLLCSFVIACGERRPAPTVGQPVPDFAVPSLDGTTVQLSDYRGHVVVVNFWATWCPPCVDEMPSLERLQKALGPKGLKILALSVDHSREDILQFKQEHALSLDILHDEGARVARSYQTFKYPETYIVDPSGILVAKVIGPRDWIAPRVIRELVELLKEDPALS